MRQKHTEANHKGLPAWMSPTSSLHTRTKFSPSSPYITLPQSERSARRGLRVPSMRWPRAPVGLPSVCTPTIPAPISPVPVPHRAHKPQSKTTSTGGGSSSMSSLVATAAAPAASAARQQHGSSNGIRMVCNREWKSLFCSVVPARATASAGLKVIHPYKGPPLHQPH